MQLENVNWTDYSWWVMMSLFRSKILISINFFRPVARLFQASEKKVQTISFTIWRLVYDFWIFFLLRFKVFVLKTPIFIHREKDWVINRIVNDIKYYIFFSFRETQIFALFEWHLQTLYNFYYLKNLEKWSRFWLVTDLFLLIYRLIHLIILNHHRERWVLK